MPTPSKSGSMRIVVLIILLLSPLFAAAQQNVAGHWKLNFADSIASGTADLVLQAQDDGSVTGTFTTNQGGMGTVRGRLNGQTLSLTLTQTLAECPGVFTAEITLEQGKGAGNYSGKDCQGDHAKGVISILRVTDPYRTPAPDMPAPVTPVPVLNPNAKPAAPNPAAIAAKPVSPPSPSLPPPGAGSSSRSSSTIPVFRWATGAPGSYLIYADNAPMELVSSEGIDLVTSLYGIEKSPERIGFVVIVLNKTNQTMDIDPSKFSLQVTAPTEKELAYLSPESIRHSIERRARLHASFVGFARGLAGNSQTTVSDTQGTVNATDSDGTYIHGNYNATTTSTTTTSQPDPVTQQQIAQIYHSTHARSDAVDYFALKHNTLFPGQKLIGFVWFKWDKHARQTLLRVPVMNGGLTNGVVFEFPYGEGQQGK